MVGQIMETEFEHFDLVENKPVSNFGEQPNLKIAMFTDVFLDVPGGIPSSIMAFTKPLLKLTFCLAAPVAGLYSNSPLFVPTQ